jgi:hypothetical protein
LTSASLAIAPRFTSGWEFSCGRAPVRIPGVAGPIGPMALIDREGNVVTQDPYQSVDVMRDGRAGVTTYAGRCGYVDESGAVVLEPQFLKAHRFSCGVGRVSGAGERFVRKDGSFLVDRAFSWTSDFSDGVGLAWDGKRWFAFDTEGRLLFESSETSFLRFREGLAPFRRGELWGFADQTGACVIEPRYAEARAFSGGRGIVRHEGKLRLIDREGRLVGSAHDWSHESFSEGRLASWSFHGGVTSCGYIGEDGELAIPHRFRTITPFSEGVAAVAAEDRWGFVDKAGAMVIEPAFDEARPFVNGFAAVKRDGQWGAIDHAGNLVVPVEFEELGPFGDGLSAVRLP